MFHHISQPLNSISIRSATCVYTAAKTANVFQWDEQPPKFAHYLEGYAPHLIHCSLGPPAWLSPQVCTVLACVHGQTHVDDLYCASIASCAKINRKSNYYHCQETTKCVPLKEKQCLCNCTVVHSMHVGGYFVRKSLSH